MSYQTDHDLLRNHILTNARIDVPTNRHELTDLLQTQWSSEFERLIRNRLLAGSYRYGKMNQDGKPTYNCADSIIKRMKQYKQDGNLEWLADCAALLFIEFVEGEHPRRHWRSIDDTDIHTKPAGDK